MSGAETARVDLEGGLRVMDEIDDCLRKYHDTGDKSQTGDATKKLREVSVSLKALAANPDAKTHDNMPLLIALSKRMKEAVAQMKELAGSDSATNSGNTANSNSSNNNNRASLVLSTGSASGDDSGAPAPAAVVPSNAPAANGIPLEIQGYLMKQGEKGVIKSWKKRWFVLREARLYYYKDAEDSVPINFIDMRDAVVTEPGEPNKQNDFGLKFQVVVNKRIYRLKCLSIDDAKRWLSILVNATHTYNATIKKSDFRLSMSPREPVRIVEKGTVDIAAVERERKDKEQQQADEQRRRSNTDAAVPTPPAVVTNAPVSAPSTPVKPTPPPKQHAVDEAPHSPAPHSPAPAPHSPARHASNTAAPPPVALPEQHDNNHAEPAAAVETPAAAAAAAPTDHSHDASEREQPVAAERVKPKIVKQSVVGAWPSFDVKPVAPDPKAAAAAAHAAASKADTAKSTKAFEKLEAELAAKDRELTKEQLASAAAAEQARVLTLERNQMADEFEPLVQRLSKSEDENAQLRRALAEQDAKVAAQAAEIKQLQASLAQARQAQSDGQLIASQLAERLRSVESPKKPTKKQAADDRERIIEMAHAHQEQCTLLEHELRRTKQVTAAQVQELESALRAARAESGDLLQRYQQARQCSIALSKNDFVAALETELSTVKKELFFALAAGTKLQCAMRGEPCNLAIDELFEQAQIEKVAVSKFPKFISDATERQVEEQTVAASSSSSSSMSPNIQRRAQAPLSPKQRRR
jgi:hypothetical protein